MAPKATDRSSLDLVIEEYKKGIDRTLLRENLRRTMTQRVEQLQAMAAAADELRKAGRALRRGKSVRA